MGRMSLLRKPGQVVRCMLVPKEAGTSGAVYAGPEGVRTLVDTATDVVEMMVLRAGQLVISGPQLVTVTSWVE